MNVMNTDAIRSSSSIASRAMLVSLSISQWSGRKFDKQTTDEVVQQKHAQKGAARVNRLLIPQHYLDPIQKVISKMRAAFNAHTAPWTNDGLRIIAADAYFKLGQTMQALEPELESAVSDFVNNWHQIQQEGISFSGGMYKASDYPHQFQIASKFGMSIKTLPVPTADDFRVQMSDHQAERIRKEIEKTVSTAAEEAMSEVTGRVVKALERMSTNLAAYKPAKAKGEKTEGRLYETVVTNVRDLIDILPALNITGDPRLDLITERLKVVAENDVSVLKENDALRQQTAEQAQLILNDMAAIYG